MLMLTNRVVDAALSDARAFSLRFTPDAERLSLAEVAPSGGAWTLSAIRVDASDEALLAALRERLSTRPLMLYLHGNNNAPASAFERCRRLAALHPGVEVVGFSWPSEGALPDGGPASDAAKTVAPQGVDADDAALAGADPTRRDAPTVAGRVDRYRQAKLNAEASARAVSRLLRALASARLLGGGQPASLVVHSLGAHLLRRTLAVDGTVDALRSLANVCLAAACVPADGHAAWLDRVKPRVGVQVAYNRNDSVLWAAQLVDGDGSKLGLDPGTARAANARVRYVDFSDAQTGLGGHRYLLAQAGVASEKRAHALFARVFSGQPDIAPGAPPMSTYFDCDADLKTCTMGAPAGLGVG